MSWDDYFFNICKAVSAKSKDKNTQVGCVIVGLHKEVRSTGFNGIPIGVQDDDRVAERYERPEKYAWAEHSERNAIYLAARNGVPLEGCSIYVTWMPCAECARAIIQSGIKTVNVLEYSCEDAIKYPMFRFDVTLKMFYEAHINVHIRAKV